jgi:NADPH:quinone reductase-like Zn-dependent oxidoreductase
MNARVRRASRPTINRAKAIMTSSSDEKLERTKNLGAYLTINYKTTPDWENMIHQYTDGKGVDIVIETIGGNNLQKSLNVLRMGGHISAVGLLNGFEANINTLALLYQQATIKGMEVGSTDDFIAMNHAIEAYDIHPVIDKIFTLEQTQAAFDYLEDGKHFGKVVIKLSDL